MRSQTAVDKEDPRGGLARDYMESFDIKSTIVCDDCGTGRPDKLNAMGWYKRELHSGDTEDFCPDCLRKEKRLYLYSAVETQAREIVNELVWRPAINLEHMIRSVIPKQIAMTETLQKRVLAATDEAVKEGRLSISVQHWIIRRMEEAMEKLKEAYDGKKSHNT